MTDQREKIKIAAVNTVREWTLQQLSEGNNPTLDDFLEQFPNFDVKALHESMGKEMFNAKHGLPYTG